MYGVDFSTPYFISSKVKILTKIQLKISKAEISVKKTKGVNKNYAGRVGGRRKAGTCTKLIYHKSRVLGEF